MGCGVGSSNCVCVCVGGVRAIGEEKMVVFFCEEEGENGHSVKVKCLVIFKKKKYS